MISEEQTLRAYLSCEIKYREFARHMREALQIDQLEGEFSIRFLKKDLPRVLFTAANVRHACDRFESGLLSEEEFTLWAKLISLLDCYYLDESNEEMEIAVWNFLDHVAAAAVSKAFEPWVWPDLRSTLGEDG